MKGPEGGIMKIIKGSIFKCSHKFCQYMKTASLIMYPHSSKTGASLSTHHHPPHTPHFATTSQLFPIGYVKVLP